METERVPCGAKTFVRGLISWRPKGGARPCFFVDRVDDTSRAHVNRAKDTLTRGLDGRFCRRTRRPFPENTRSIHDNRAHCTELWHVELSDFPAKRCRAWVLFYPYAPQLEQRGTRQEAGLFDTFTPRIACSGERKGVLTGEPKRRHPPDFHRRRAHIWVLRHPLVLLEGQPVDP